MTRRLAHLSDLHFGRDDPAVAAGLRDDLRRCGADLVLVSGDLTPRARRRHFRQARAFLDGLGIPWLAVPGNHDVPLYDLGRRLLDPYGRYRRFVHPHLEPEYQDRDIAVLGLNTVLPRVWKGGLVRQHALRRLQEWSRGAGDRLRVVVAHHPFTRHDASTADLVRGWREAVQAMEQAGVDLVLTGHLHRFGLSPARAAAAGGPHSLVVVRASTSISTRRRGEPNAYGLVHVDPDRLAVESRAWDGARFTSQRTRVYPRPRHGLAGPGAFGQDKMGQPIGATHG